MTFKEALVASNDETIRNEQQDRENSNDAQQSPHNDDEDQKDDTASTTLNDADYGSTRETITHDDDMDIDDYTRLKREHWKNSPYAVGLVDISWKDQRRRESCLVCCSPSAQPNTCCLVLTSYVCACTGRIGNMVVFKENKDKPQPVCMVGPYWPCLVFFTFPLILIISVMVYWQRLYDNNDMPVWAVVIWFVFTLSLVLALIMVACRNPGIWHRHSTLPQEQHDGDSTWTWNDQAQTYRPPKARYDVECAVVVQDYDHTCPWTGTAIGKRNICAFRTFCGLVVVCMLMDIAIFILRI